MTGQNCSGSALLPVVLRHWDAECSTQRRTLRSRFGDAHPSPSPMSLVVVAARVACTVASAGRDCSGAGGSGGCGSGFSGVGGAGGGRGGGDSSGRPGIVSQNSTFDTLECTASLSAPLSSLEGINYSPLRAKRPEITLSNYSWRMDCIQRDSSQTYTS